jgi:ATP/maltotriose-dependent transcriptional regulator MalT
LVEGERAIATARDFDQTSMLARLQYWVGAVYLHRGEIAEAQRLFDDAWHVSGADGVDAQRKLEVHGVLPAMVARVMWLGAIGEHTRAIALGREAMALAERTGYVAWTVYRLLPAIAESAMAMQDQATLAGTRDTLARDSAKLSHAIGRGWVSVIDGEIARQHGDLGGAVTHLQHAIATLEAVPFPFDAARTRVRLARVLQAQGDTEEATREARAALQVFESLAAKPAIEDARTVLRTLGARMPTRRAAPGFDGLTGRELEIVRLVARRLSNKEIGAQLDISARTVGTHLANVFDKTSVRDRTALGDLAREQGLHRV